MSPVLAAYRMNSKLDIMASTRKLNMECWQNVKSVIKAANQPKIEFGSIH